MAFDYGAMQKLATGLLTDFNQGEIALIVTTPGTGPDHNPGPPTRATKQLKGTASASFSVTGASKAYKPGFLVQIGDVKVTTEVLDGVDPEMSDKLTIDGREYNIVGFIRSPEAGITVAWSFYVRK